MKKILQDEGFTLVELMVVVAIIGILSAVAIPNFKQYQAKSKTSEAKLQLASIYSAETTMMGDWDTFATCLTDMGYTAAARGYYVVGFATDNTARNADVVSNGGACANGQNRLTPATSGTIIRVKGTNAVVGDLDASNIVATDGSTFKAGAAGKISADTSGASNLDEWSIDQDKTLNQDVRGY